MINKDTKLCISIAEKPSNFGSTIFNNAFQFLALDYVYKPFCVLVKDLPQAIQGIKALGIRGCGVSMPHKIKVLKYLDKVDKVAKKIGAVNTIVNKKGKLIGYNTDYIGAKRALEENYNVRNKKVLLIGAGGVARAIIVALIKLGAGSIFIANRDNQKAKLLAKRFKLNFCNFSEVNNFRGDLLINATSVGMSPNKQEMIINKQSIKHYEVIMDVVIALEMSALIKASKSMKKNIIIGAQMSMYQAASQFELYTGKKAPFKVIKQSIKEYLKLI